jgi:hypothetical protein
MSRVWQYCLVAFPDHTVWTTLVRLGQALEQQYFEQYGNGVRADLIAARASFHDAISAELIYTKPRVNQACGCGSGSEMVKQNNQASKPRPGKKPSAAQGAAQAFNAPTHRGFRNKGKVAAGRVHPGTKQQAQPKARFNRSNAAAPAATGTVVSRQTRRKQLIARTGVQQSMITDLSTSASSPGTFQVLYTGYLNPGNGYLFERQQAIANTYEKWRLRKLEISVMPVVSTNTSGVYGMYIDMDATDTADTNINSAMENRYSTMGPLWRAQKLVLNDPAVLNKWLYTSTSTAAASSANALDRQQAVGVLRFFADKCPASQPIGMVEITYEYEYLDPKPPIGLMLTAYTTSNPSYNTSAVPQSTTNYFPLPLNLTTGFDAHGINVTGTRVSYNSGGTQDDEVEGLANSGFTINDAGGGMYQVFAYYGAGSVGLNSAPAGSNIGLALIGITGGVASATWTVFSTPAVNGTTTWSGGTASISITVNGTSGTPVPTVYAFAFFVQAPSSSAGPQMAGAFSNSSAQSVSVARAVVRAGYGLAAQPRLTYSGVPVSRAGSLPDTGLDDFLALYAGSSYAITVYQPAEEKFTPDEQRMLERVLAYLRPPKSEAKAPMELPSFDGAARDDHPSDDDISDPVMMDPFPSPRVLITPLARQVSTLDRHEESKKAITRVPRS